MSSVNPIRADEPPVVDLDTFGKRLGHYTRWREELAALIHEYQTWVETQGLSSGEDDLRIYELLDGLRADKLNVALVAEFSRGKTELINAIFFADYKQRLLPSDAGRTTMCPTELLYDERMPPCVRLLPIESRKTHATIAELKRQPIQWTTLPLELDNPKQMAQTLLESTRTKGVSPREAEELGLYSPRAGRGGPSMTPDGKIEVPVWRHAVINFPHPLLRQGLVVLDTPGLNSLGTEPELTLNMIPAAHAVLFLLAADTGVTKSDLEVWANHVCAARQRADDARIAVLNKIDTLWDELRGEPAVTATIARQAQEVARHLSISKNNVFPVSAQKGLLAKIKGDYALLERSGLPELELKLSGDLVAAKQQLLRDKVTRQIGAIIETTTSMIEARLHAVNKQLGELRAMSGQSQETIQTLIQRMRQEKAAYDKTLASFQATRTVLNEQIKTLLEFMSLEAFDALSGRARHAMADAWTTHGLRAAMKTLFEGMIEAMDKANRQTQQIRGLVQAIYNKFHTEHGLAHIKPAGFSLLNERAALQKLYEEAERYRNSPVMVATEAHFVVKRFFITLVSRTRDLFSQCNAATHNWSKAVMAPILAQVREHKIMMDQRLENLKKVHENLDNLSSRITELEAAKHGLETQLATIGTMRRKLTTPVAAGV
jgi:cell division protein FtsB